MSKTVSSIVLLIGMTIGGTVSAKDCKQFLDEEYFSNRQQLRNESKLKRLHKQHIAREMEAEYKAEIESAMNGHFDPKAIAEDVEPESDILADYSRIKEHTHNDDDGFSLASVFEEWEDKKIT